VYDCAAAATAGYLDHIVDPGELLDAAVDHAARLGRLHRRSYLATRKLIFAPVLAEVEQALARKAARESEPGEPAPR
jgi:enoyl-CoA hydratase/carnithine racemase